MSVQSKITDYFEQIMLCYARLKQETINTNSEGQTEEVSCWTLGQMFKCIALKFV